MFDVTAAVLETPVLRAFPDCVDVVDDREHGTRTEVDIELDESENRRRLNTTVSSLYEGDRLVGRLLFCRMSPSADGSSGDTRRSSRTPRT